LEYELFVLLLLLVGFESVVVTAVELVLVPLLLRRRSLFSELLLLLLVDGREDRLLLLPLFLETSPLLFLEDCLWLLLLFDGCFFRDCEFPGDNEQGSSESELLFLLLYSWDLDRDRLLDRRFFSLRISVVSVVSKRCRE